jgi:putative FmdB family regulatory protein
MPTYEYRCPKGHEFDLFQRMSDEPRAACPECGESAERLMSAGAGLIFKGEGFYITDYRSDAYKKAASSDREAAASENKAPGGDSGSDSGGDSGGKSGEGKGSSDGGGASDAGSSGGSSKESKAGSSDSSSSSSSSGRSKTYSSTKSSSSGS